MSVSYEVLCESPEKLQKYCQQHSQKLAGNANSWEGYKIISACFCSWLCQWTEGPRTCCNGNSPQLHLPVSFSGTCPSCPVPSLDMDPALSLEHPWDRGRIQRVKETKLLGSDTDRSMGKGKARKQNQEFILCFPQAGGCSSIPRWAGLHPRQWWLGDTNAITSSIPPFLLLPPLSRLILTPRDLGISWGEVRVTCPSCVSPPSWCSPSPLTGEAGQGTGKALALDRKKASWNFPPISSPNPSLASEKPLGRKLTPPSPNQSPVPICQHWGQHCQCCTWCLGIEIMLELCKKL